MEIKKTIRNNLPFVKGAREVKKGLTAAGDSWRDGKPVRAALKLATAPLRAFKDPFVTLAVGLAVPPLAGSLRVASASDTALSVGKALKKAGTAGATAA